MHRFRTGLSILFIRKAWNIWINSNSMTRSNAFTNVSVRDTTNLYIIIFWQEPMNSWGISRMPRSEERRVGQAAGARSPPRLDTDHHGLDEGSDGETMIV